MLSGMLEGSGTSLMPRPLDDAKGCTDTQADLKVRLCDSWFCERLVGKGCKGQTPMGRWGRVRARVEVNAPISQQVQAGSTGTTHMCPHMHHPHLPLHAPPTCTPICIDIDQSLGPSWVVSMQSVEGCTC